MKRTTVLHLHHSGLYRLLAENTSLVCFSVLFVCSVLAGCLLFRFGYFQSGGEELYNRYILPLGAETFGGVFTTQLLINFSCLLLFYFFGTSMLGVAFIPSLLAARGLLTGWLLARLYQGNGLNGIVLNLLVFLPGELMVLPPLIAGARQSLHLSLSLGRYLVYRDIRAEENDTKLFFKRLLFFAGITVAGCLFRSLLLSAFASYFELR